MTPENRQLESLFRRCFQEAGRIHTAKPYPLIAPNGSTIILVGCENGLKILWRGGQPAESQPRQRSWKDDGTLLHNVAVGSKGQADANSLHEDASHEQTGEDSSSSQDFEPVIESISLPFGTAVLHIAFPFIPPDSSQHKSDSLPALCSDRLVAAMRLRRCVSLTLAPSSASPGSELDMDQDDAQSRKNVSDRRRFTSKLQSRSRSAGRDNGWDLLVASSSSDSSGLLLIHRIQLSPHGRELKQTTTDFNLPLSIQQLPCSAASLSFNPSLPGDERNSRLLLADRKGTIRILDCHSAEASNECPCLISLYTSLQSTSNRRGAGKHVLDAQWVLGGSAVLVLLENGEWGVWDLEGHGPKAQSTSKAPVTPTLGSLFMFAIRGHLNDGSNTFKSDNADAASIKEASKPAMLAPTTPSTRRMRQANLFAGPLRHAKGPAHGGISLVPDQDSKIGDEAVVMWYNNAITVIPSLRTHWADKVKGSGNLFGNGARGEARTIHKVSLRGERRIDVALLPASDQSTYGAAPEYTVLVTRETRYVLVTSPSSGQRAIWGNQLSPRSDPRMLEQGDLDLDGMDRMLSTMNEKTELNEFSANGVYQKRKVGLVDI
ncbi:MAG: hypothetical protein LQ343_002296 [Gyalolechia ehrenbergii]|nr:MAG: hypothetical protein LQ343_002296 [Gyalolechia ehrenbergii]